MNNNLKHKTRVNLSLYFLSFLLLIFVSCAKEPKSEMSENDKLVAEYILKFKDNLFYITKFGKLPSEK
jgi:hypothetical protein